MSSTEDALTSLMATIAGAAMKRTSHIPPINFQLEVPVIYAFEIRTDGALDADSTDGWLPRFLKTGPPLLG